MLVPIMMTDAKKVRAAPPIHTPAKPRNAVEILDRGPRHTARVSASSTRTGRGASDWVKHNGRLAGSRLTSTATRAASIYRAESQLHVGQLSGAIECRLSRGANSDIG